MKAVMTTGKIVNLRTFTIFFWACLIATAAIAGEEHWVNTSFNAAAEPAEVPGVLCDQHGEHGPDGYELRIVKKKFNETI